MNREMCIVSVGEGAPVYGCPLVLRVPTIAGGCGGMSSANIITTRLVAGLDEVNRYANEFLGEQVLPGDALAAEEAFQRVYFLVGAEHAGKQAPRDRLRKIDSAQLALILDSVGEPRGPLATALTNFVSVYLLLLVYARASQVLVRHTSRRSNDLRYWDALHASVALKWVYLVQVLPQRLVGLARAVVAEGRTERFELPATAWPAHTVEDNQMYFVWARARHVAATAAAAAWRAVQRLMAVPLYKLLQMGHRHRRAWRDPLGSLGAYLRIILGAPLRAASRDIDFKRRAINDDIDAAAYHLGCLIQQLPTNINTVSREVRQFVAAGDSEQFAAALSTLETIYGGSDGSTPQRLRQLLAKIERPASVSDTAPPGWWTRHWPVLLGALWFAPRSAALYANRHQIYRWLQINLVDTVTGFVQNWLIKPIGDMLSVMRHDDLAELSLTSRESLQLDLDLLERMVVDYSADYTAPSDLEAMRSEIHDAVKEGNLTVLMSKYEQDIRTPLKSTLKGSLPRALLIQVQKTKVDGAVALNGIDKLLKSQQLVFGVVSISPSVLIVYQAWRVLRAQLFDRPIVINGKQATMVCLKCLNTIDKYLSRYSEASAHERVYIEGYLLIEVLSLKQQSLRLLPNAVKEMWVEDLDLLNDTRWSIEARLRVMARIWSAYGHYFR